MNVEEKQTTLVGGGGWGRGLVTCTVHDWSRGQKREQHNNAVPALNNNAAVGCDQGTVKILLLKGAGLMV